VTGKVRQLWGVAFPATVTFASFALWFFGGVGNSIINAFRVYLPCNQTKGDTTMPETRNLCAQLPLALHAQVCEAREAAGLTTAQYITQLLTEYYEMKENGGKMTMATNSRTMAFQIPEELFMRIKTHLERETARTGRKLTQREFVLGLIEEALEAAERQADSPEPEEAGAGPCEAQPEGSGTQPQEEDDPAALSA
jgi:hypothetical protein